MSNHMIHLAEQAYEAHKFEDVAYFEPFYLKEFQATVAKNQLSIPDYELFSKNRFNFT